jgi:tRNA (adenine57-N1/adenine58-N1)-methyltransferase
LIRTGSGSFSHSIARTISPGGKLFSFEYHKERQETAEKEFLAHGLQDVILSQHRNVCKDGFELENEVTSIFLDLPSPWECIDRPDFIPTFMRNRLGRVCCFSPCVEQVQLTCKSLEKAGFTDIRMFEVLVRDHDVKLVSVCSLPTSKETKKLKRKWISGNDLTEGEEGVLASRIVEKVRGHTSYLTFATIVPKV